MNNLTLIGYLKKQIKNNGCGSLSISKLSSYSLEHNELLHHIALYAYLTDKIHLCGKNEALCMECMKIKNNENYIRDCKEYAGIYDAYKEEIGEFKKEDEFKAKIRKRILELQKEKSISNYRIYTDLGLNPGNVNSFLKNGDYRKLSLNIVRRIWKYVERI